MWPMRKCDYRAKGCATDSVSFPHKAAVGGMTLTSHCGNPMGIKGWPHWA